MVLDSRDDGDFCCVSRGLGTADRICTAGSSSTKQCLISSEAIIEQAIDDEMHKTTNRRIFLGRIGAAVSARLLLRPTTVSASDGVTTDDVYQRRTDQFAYEFRPPSGFSSPSQKPLKTHLDEVNFKSSDGGGYQYGITVDPLRINSLEAFGTPEEVAAKVVTAEVNRDRVFDVKLMEDPVSGTTTSSKMFYQLNYPSSGKRGQKRFVAKFFIENQKLYALTAQCKEEDYERLRPELLQAVRSFRVV